MNNVARRIRFQSGGDYQIYVGTGFVGDVKPHSHDFFQCMIVSEGLVVENQNGKEYEQRKYDAFITPRGTTHSLKVGSTLTSYYCLSFSQEISAAVFSMFHEPVLSHVNTMPMIHIDSATGDNIFALCDILIQEQEITSGHKISMGAALTEAILVMIIRSMFQENDDGKTGESTEEVIHDVADYIEQHYAEKITTDALVKMSKLSKTALFNFFPQYTGMTIKQYIDEKRIHEAVDKSFSSNKTWNEIAEEVGYSEFSTFYRNFVKILGVSPTEYRKQAGYCFPKE